MATLVLSTVGTVLGGPIGGAIGSLVGQSIDQQIFGSSRKGPRLGDLKVQSSAYGTEIPRIYGTMRVAGTVVWATDLVESTQTSGAKGQPDTTYSYSVSLAIALSSRPAQGVKRIWADGKLLRGAAGDFKVSTAFRFYEGREDQIVDPLIASVEGLSSCPAYRGLALAVFEDLELAEYGNRIPFLTFEVEADATSPTVAAILADASSGLIESGVATLVGGYAALGGSKRSAVEPLVESFAVEILDNGIKLGPPLSIAATAIRDDDLGATPDSQRSARIEREQIAARLLPATLTLGYQDRDRDYQSGQSRAHAAEQNGVEARIELPAVLSAAAAKSLVEEVMARRWAKRDRLVLRLPPTFLALQPGAVIELPSSPTRWTVERSTIDGFVTRAELRPAWGPQAVLPADPGRSLPSPDVVVGPVSLALVETPDITGAGASAPMLYLAASSPTAGWRSMPVDVSASGWSANVGTALRKSVVGRTIGTLAAGPSELLDLTNQIDVQLVDPEQWLLSCDDDQLVQGANLAMLGSELIQFADAEPMGAGRYRLRRLLRGRRGTEWAAEHLVDESFVLIDSATLQLLALPAWTRGSTVTAAGGAGFASSPPSVSLAVTGEAMRPPSPVHCQAVLLVSGDLYLSWTRRSRLGSPWLDDVDAPLGEAEERYAVEVAGPAAVLAVETSIPELTLASAQLAAAGAGQATVSVRQIGDWAASSPATTVITLP